jgi:CheY-like chemotaxis protein
MITSNLGPDVVSSRRPLTMILAEDNDSHAKLVMRAMQSNTLNLRIQHLSDGQQVVDLLKELMDDDHASLPELILLDLRLPRMDGMEVLKWIKTSSKFKKIPVVVFSSSENSEEIQRAYSLGANSYLIKPLDYDKLKTLVLEVSKYWLETNQNPG